MKIEPESRTGAASRPVEITHTQICFSICLKMRNNIECKVDNNIFDSTLFFILDN